MKFVIIIAVLFPIEHEDTDYMDVDTGVNLLRNITSLASDVVPDVPAISVSNSASPRRSNNVRTRIDILQSTCALKKGKPKPYTVYQKIFSNVVVGVLAQLKQVQRIYHFQVIHSYLTKLPYLIHLFSSFSTYFPRTYENISFMNQTFMLRKSSQAVTLGSLQLY